MSMFMNLFGRSPIRPMQQHMQAAAACARAVLPLVEDMVAGRTANLPQRRREIDELEHEADRIKHEIRSHLPKRLMLAVERRDLLEILDFQRSMTVPPELAEPLLQLTRRVIDACDGAQRIIDELDELLETGFAGREVGRVEEMIKGVSLLESDTDRLAEAAQRKLFSLEGQLGVGTVFWYDLINWVARMADFAERVGNRLRLLIAT
jgi:uncharacterized protein Yka (UPF0111/DUF47 family)